MQQVMFVPTLTHSDMFYTRQLSCYNFCVHICDKSESFMSMWHECQAGQDGNEIVSCLCCPINNINLKKFSNME